MNNDGWKSRLAVLCLGSALVMGLSGCGKTSGDGNSAASVTASSAVDAEVVRVTASDFSWNLSKTEFKAGQQIRFQLEGKDGFHGFSIVGTDVSQPIKQGESKEVSWTPEKPGTYTVKCNHMCGSGHSSMETNIIVT